MDSRDLKGPREARNSLNLLSPRRRGPWPPLVASGLLHGLLVLLAFLLSRRPDPEADERDTRPDAPQQQVEMIYIPPPPPAARPRPQPPAPEPTPIQPRPRPATPPPPKAQTTPEPEPNAAPDAERTEGSDDPAGSPAPPPDQPRAAEDAGQPSPPTDLATAAMTMESEARRIFGRPRLPTPPGAGPQQSRPMQTYLPDNPQQCIPRPSPPRHPGSAPELGTAVGRIFRGDNGAPLSGAHLQMLGTPYVTFTDARGEYRFTFDLALVENCRTQYVRVSAQGYESRLLVLVIGENVRSEDVRLRRR